MSLSVVICTWNRAELLRQTLSRLVQVGQRPPSWELLVVNNNSTDHTRDVALQFATALPMRVVDEPRVGLSHARNRGLTEARGDVVAFTDDDVLVSDRWLTACVEAAAAWPEAGCFGGPVRPWFPVPPDPELLEAFPLLARGFCGTLFQSDVPVLLPASETLVGACMAFRRAAVENLAFDPELGRQGEKLAGQEDFVFVEAVRQRGWKVAWVPDMAVSHYVDPSRMTEEYLARYTRDNAAQAYSAAQYGAGSALAGGMPHWMLKAFVGQFARYLVRRLVGPRREALDALRETSRLRGLLAGARQHSRAAS